MTFIYDFYTNLIKILQSSLLNAQQKSIPPAAQQQSSSAAIFTQGQILNPQNIVVVSANTTTNADLAGLIDSDSTLTSLTHSHFIALIEIAHKEYQAGNYSKAEQHCLALLQQNPHNIGVLLLLSSIAFQQKNYDRFKPSVLL